MSEFTTSRTRDPDLEVSSRAQSVPTSVTAAAERLKKVAANGGASTTSGAPPDNASLFASLNSGSCSLPGNIGAPSRFARLGEANLKASQNAWQVRTWLSQEPASGCTLLHCSFWLHKVCSCPTACPVCCSLSRAIGYLIRPECCDSQGVHGFCRLDYARQGTMYC
jgi:hypothetical protein